VAVGSFVYLDNTTTFYAGTVVMPTATTLKFITHNNADYLGALPSFAVASGDELHVQAMWELA
jgi:hypothetical protein